ncbi:hypothetical protein BXZ70DRAFT_61868 [Cristinia sonorae]|uniref:Uncharacterized protein n=1 Tax=Cristinia sonorae TaxID=1940300 RepID=A0A8K0XRC1_9AGAR|nr:hypothetical protein BXZ70DRAFT_61868 [Cristinia sonorae]
MSSLFHPPYLNLLVSDMTQEISFITTSSTDSIHDSSTTTVTFREAGIRSLFRSSVLRKQYTAQFKVQSSAIRSLRARLAQQEHAARSLREYVSTVEARYQQVAGELGTLRKAQVEGAEILTATCWAGDSGSSGSFQPLGKTHNCRLQHGSDNPGLSTILCDVTTEEEALNAQELRCTLEQLQVLQRKHFDLQCELKKAREAMDEEKDELELSLFATELERDIYKKNEQDLEKAMTDKTGALDAAETLATEERLAKEQALLNLHAAEERLASLLEDSGGQDTGALQAALREREDLVKATHEEMARLNAQLMNREETINDQRAEITSLMAALDEANERCTTSSKQLQGECEAHHETRGDLGLIIRRLATLSEERDDLQTKLREAKENAEEAQTTLDMTTRRLSWELEQAMTQREGKDMDIEAEREEKTNLEERAQFAVDELTRENRSLEQSKRVLEETLLAKVNRCEELESQVSQLMESMRAVSDGEGGVQKAMFGQKNTEEISVSAKRTSWDKENAHTGSMYDMSAPRIIPIRRSSTMNTYSSSTENNKNPNPQPITSSERENRAFTTRLFNPQSLRKFFVSSSQIKKSHATAQENMHLPDTPPASTFRVDRRVAEEFTSPEFI